MLCCVAFLSSLQELSDQQLKQMLLAYMVLIMKGRAMQLQDLDNACEVRQRRLKQHQPSATKSQSTLCATSQGLHQSVCALHTSILVAGYDVYTGTLQHKICSGAAAGIQTVCLSGALVIVLQDFLMKEFEHPIDYALESALPRLQAWGLVTINSQVRTGGAGAQHSS